MSQPVQNSRYSDVLGVSAQERNRLLEQARDLEPETRWLLDRVGIGPGWRAIDVGCGPLGILNLLSERVAPDGEVVGLELEQRFVDLATQIIGERQLANVQVVQGDATATGLPRGSFDLVHERLVLIGPMRGQVLAEMIALTRPGGIVATQEIDMLSAFCEPSHPAWDRLLEAFLAFVGRHGAQLAGARRLPGFLREAGLADVSAEAHTRVAQPGTSRRAQLPALITSIRGPLIRDGIISDAELTELAASLSSHLEDPRTLVVGGLVIQAWGRKPAS